MDKNLIWKSLLIVAVVCLMALNLYPPQETLKPGIDLAGGTSLIYEIDTTGLERSERKGLAQNMIPILLKRIDPTHVANIVMRPQGDSRIEIQLPLASKDTQNKREAYNTALTALEADNINLLKIRQMLSLDAEKRGAEFETIVDGNENRSEILTALADIYDQRKQAQDQRDTLLGEMDTIESGLKELGADVDGVETVFRPWAKLDSEAQTEAIENWVKTNVKEDADTEDALSEKQIKAVAMIGDYLAFYGKYLPVTEELARPDDGLNTQWNSAIKDLAQLNLSIDLVREILEMPKDSAARAEKITGLEEQFPERKARIAAVVAAYDQYRVVGGRLDDPEDLKRMLKGSGVLEFRILPTGDEGNAGQLEAYRVNLSEKGPKLASDSRYVWCEIEEPEKWHPGLGITGSFGEKTYVLCSNQTNEKMLHDGEKKWKLKSARPTTDQQGRRAIGFTFDDVAANKFFIVTGSNLGEPLCILLDDRAISAPRIDSERGIRSSGIITGSFTQTEISDMVNKLNAGSFPARLSEVPISEKTISATIGVDNRDKGVKAGLYGMAAVVVFLLLYYLLSGVIADVALALNILIVLGIMALLQSTFTLPGIAGLILTIGMSVDANVLIFERIREEQKRGSTLKSAIANGYSRAFRTIFDANITTFGVAGILYMAASEEIKGFAIVLMLGIISSMFTALFVTRVVFDWLTGSRLLTNHLAMPWEVAKNTTINWMALRPIFLTISSILIVGGLGVFFTRDDAANSKYDIEFIGGTNVGLEFKNGSSYANNQGDVEKDIQQALNSPVTVYAVGETGLEFEINTTLTNKTTALLTFSTGSNTSETVAQMIRKAAEDSDTVLSGLTVTPTAAQPNQFEISTSRVNASLVQDVLTVAAGEAAMVSDVEVHEIVSEAVRETFKDHLAIREDLGLTVTTIDQIKADDEDASLLSDYLGGVKLSCTLEREATLTELTERIRDLQFKPDTQDLDRYSYLILKSNLTEPDADEKLTEFIYISTHPEAGYRDLDSNERANFVQNEKTKLTNAASLETSLSRVTQIDPSIGSQAKQKALVAIILSLIAIVGYIWIRFGTARYGFAAIAALVHDVCITLGIVTACTYLAGTPLGNALGIQDFKINLAMVAAFLTIIGYSLNDTIVVFDRIRENRGKLSILTPDMISTSINQTLSRTLLTSFTTFMVVLVMYIWGGAGLRGFTFALLIGIIVGTYSSIAIAAPILLLGQSKGSKK
ncbi:MAG: protein translocase subunit SecD [Planctomycetota bacterium]|jgi:SecD/SecF fusion protein